MNYFWESLPFGRKISRILLIVFYSVTLVMLLFGIPLLAVSLFATEAFDDFDRQVLAVMAGIGIIGFPLSLVWWKLEIREWKLRYLIPGKTFKAEFGKLLKHYGAYAEETKLLKKQCKECYHHCGKPFDPNAFDAWLCRETDGVKHVLDLALALEACCKSGGGFEELIRRIDKGEFTEKDTEQNCEVPMSAYRVKSRLCCGVFPEGLEHLFNRVFLLCDFSLYDNGLSEKYTLHIKDVKKKLNEVYSPILFSYEDEISEGISHLQVLLQKEQSR